MPQVLSSLQKNTDLHPPPSTHLPPFSTHLVDAVGEDGVPQFGQSKGHATEEGVVEQRLEVRQTQQVLGV